MKMMKGRVSLPIGVLALVGAFFVLSTDSNVSEKTSAAVSTFFLRHKATRGERRLLSFDPRTVELKNRYEQVNGEHGALVAVINTPKCGTGGLTSTFARSFDCHAETPTPFKEVKRYDCPDHKQVLRTHDLLQGIEALRDIRKADPEQHCMIVTGIRDPLGFMPSLFVQQHEQQICADADNNKMSRDEFVQMYRNWLAQSNDRIRNVVDRVRPHLLQEFGATSLESEMEKIKVNGGYSLLDQPNPTGPFVGCALLFLRMEDHDNWPSIISNLMPGVTYEKGVPRTEDCPNLADHYGAIQNYQLTPEERAAVIGNDPHVEAYFNVYGR